MPNIAVLLATIDMGMRTLQSALPFGPGDETFAAQCPSVPGDGAFFAVPVLPSPFRPFPSLSSFPPPF